MPTEFTVLYLTAKPLSSSILFITISLMTKMLKNRQKGGGVRREVGTEESFQVFRAGDDKHFIYVSCEKLESAR